MAAEFEVSSKGSNKSLLDAIAMLAEHNIDLNTVVTAKLEDRQVLAVNVFNKPGQWLRIAKALVDGGIETNASYMLGQKGDTMSFVFVVSDYEKSRKICSRIGECSID